ncbi:MAG: hypothetical protein AAFZ05_01550 [Pseudomonadota bacterium]
MITRCLFVATLALVAGAFAEGARADQTFVCEDGRTLTMTSAAVEDAKLHDPCVAQHFGLTVGSIKRRPSAPMIALPVRRPVFGETRSATHAATAPKALVRGDATRSAAPTVKAVPVAFAKSPRVGNRLAEMTFGTYRRVAIINARSAKAAWFQHER